MSDFLVAFTKLMTFEGTTFTNDPSDHGGATKFGLTLAFIQKYVDVNYTVAQLKDMSQQEAQNIYKDLWWDKYTVGSIIDQALATKVFLAIINMGPSQAIRLLQKALNDSGLLSHVDGVLGPLTIALCNKAPALVTLNLIAEEIKFYNALVAKDPSQIKFLKGWLNRANG